MTKRKADGGGEKKRMCEMRAERKCCGVKW